MGRKPVIGVMGRGDGASPDDEALAEELGELIAREGWVLLTGGRALGVMDAASRGAKRISGSTTLGILPSTSGGVSPHVDIAVFTGLGDARDAVNVLSSDVVIVCGSPGSGTAAEAALAIKARRPLILFSPPAEAEAFFKSLSPDVGVARTASDTIRLVREFLGRVSAPG